MLRFIKEKPTTPHLRFGLGKAPFERKRLDEIVAKKISYGIVQAGDHVPGGMPYIKSQDLNGILTLERLERTSAEIAKKYRRSEVVPGDIVFSLRGNIGVAQIVPDTIAVSNLTQGTARISVGGEYNKYVCTAIQSLDVIRQVQAYAKGSTFREISLEDLRKVTVAIPTLPEQRKIADFLTAVDGRIQQLIQKRALLEDYKKGVMQALFTQAIRFKDDHGNDFPDWEETTIGKVGRFYYGKSAPKFSLSEDALTPCVRYGELYSKYSIVIGEIRSKTNIDPKYLKFSQGGEILVPRVGEDPLDFAKYCCLLPQKGVAIGEMISVFNTKENPLFYTYYFRTLRRQFARMVEGASVSNLYFRYLEPIRIFKPPIAEQTKIADFLTAIDRKIETVATQITETQTFKRGLLQQMFV